MTVSAEDQIQSLFSSWASLEAAKAPLSRGVPGSTSRLDMTCNRVGIPTFSNCCLFPASHEHLFISGTSNLSIVSFAHPDQVHTVYLIDTPGFDDTQRSDIEILEHIAHYLSVSYANRNCISGIIFLHRISDNRTSGTTRRNITMFKELVGDVAYENVAIATTMWWKGEEEMNMRKEEQLKKEDFHDVLNGGGRMFRYTAGAGVDEEARGRQQALDIVGHLMDKAKAGPVVLKIQGEMVDEGKTLGQTSAGEVLDVKAVEEGREFETQLQEATKELREALLKQDADAARELEQLRLQLANKEQQAALDRNELKKTLVEMYNKEEKRLTEKMSEMESQWRASMQRKEQELRDAEENLRKRKLQEQEVLRMRNELVELRQSVRTKQQATKRVREGFRSSALQGLTSGVASGVIAVGKHLLPTLCRETLTTVLAVLPAIVAGMFCSVM